MGIRGAVLWKNAAVQDDMPPEPSAWKASGFSMLDSLSADAPSEYQKAESTATVLSAFGHISSA
jgi:hypothetical protein